MQYPGFAMITNLIFVVAIAAANAEIMQRMIFLK
jgi:hypothetical protein